MTEELANQKLIELEDEVFINQKYGEAAYAAVVTNPKKAFDYVIEIGLLRSRDFVILSFILPDKVDSLKELDVYDDVIAKLKLNIDEIKKNRSYLNPEKENYGLSDSNIRFLEFNSFTLNNLSENGLKNLGFPPGIVEQRVQGNLEFRDSGNIKKIHDDKKEDDFCCGDKRNLYTESQKFLEGGISISIPGAEIVGTLGGLIKLENDRNVYGITNSHVLEINERVSLLKFGKSYTEEIEVIHPAHDDAKNKKRIGSIYWKLENSQMDVGLIKIDPDVKIGNFTRTNKIDFKYPIKANIGMNVKKCGRTTGNSNGVIRSVNATLYYYSPYLKKHFFYRNQIMTSCMADEGDSGSLLISHTDHVVGIIFAKTENNTANFANHFEIIFEQTRSIECPKIKFEKFINFKNQ